MVDISSNEGNGGGEIHELSFYTRLSKMQKIENTQVCLGCGKLRTFIDCLQHFWRVIWQQVFLFLTQEFCF